MTEPTPDIAVCSNGHSYELSRTLDEAIIAVIAPCPSCDEKTAVIWKRKRPASQGGTRVES